MKLFLELLGDAICVVLLFALLWGLLVIGHAAGL